MLATTEPRFVTRAPPPVGEAEEKEESAASPDRCQFWLPNKRRLCANTPLSSSRFCGNHNPDAGARRIPCPIDPSHSVSEDNLQSHVKKCPFRKQALALESQPYYSKGINGSPDDDYVDSAAKRNTILQLSVKDFQTLLEKVKSIHSAISVVLLDSYVIPDACSAWLKQQHLDRKLPYQEKHAMQQASIVGNIEATGILRKPNESTEPFYQEVEGRDHFARDESQVPAVVEFGAGRGYLTQMLVDCYGLSKVCLIERKSYKLKADRSLRQSQNTILERLRIDIEDLNLKEVNLLKGFQYIAIGKHLCGPATDLTISCCLSGQGEENKETHSTIPNLQGLALATCCHHLCQWKHYANTQFLLSLGITKEEFHAMTWFTSWAVDADHSSELADTPFNATNSSTIEEKQSDFLGGSVDNAIRSIPTLDRARLGFMCKEIIDIGRLFWLREHGMDAQLVKYVPLSISPENHLLIAKCCG